ncbi:MAG: hypothetical protein OK457_07815, partial [Thaumarchaeota archaeon]|nr:hypothetical protein [Nitrososphaerota archaeon]
MKSGISQLALVFIALILVIALAFGAYLSLPTQNQHNSTINESTTQTMIYSTTATTSCTESCSSVISASSTLQGSSTTTSTVIAGGGCTAPCVEGIVSIGPLCPVEYVTTLTT